MKRITLISVLIFALIGAANALAQKTIYLLSDTHVLAPTLIKEGSAIEQLETSEVRMPRESADLFTSVINKALAEKPAVLMVSGDLTKDGERLCHEFMVKQLSRLVKAGIKVLVVPGNHDISNANARMYDGDEIKPAATITRDEFVQLYTPICYGKDVKRDPASLSYAAEPIHGLVVLGIDSNLDEENLLKSRGDSVNTYHTNGRIKPATLSWLCQQARIARQQGKKVMALMHHHIIEHFDGETALFPKYIVANAPAMRDSLVAAGVHTICTGHLHVTDMARDYTATDSITEIATGALCTYPFYFRTLTYQDGTLQVATHQAADSALIAAGKAQMEKLVQAHIKGMVKKCWNIAQTYISDDMKIGNEAGNAFVEPLYKRVKGPASKAYIAMLEGNEQTHPDAQAFIQFIQASLQRTLGLIPEKYADMVDYGKQQAMEMLNSLFCDFNHYGTPRQVRIDDLTAKITL